MTDFRSFSEIVRLYSNVTITEKIHGSNAQISIINGSELLAGSRTRFITPDDDNYGFARKVYDNKEELIRALGVGTHYGEWYGSGINSGYNLKEKRLALFNTKWALPKAEGSLPSWVDVVPILYEGAWREGLVPEIMQQLKEDGSKISPGFMKPEGIVIYFDKNGMRLKHTFEGEETGWRGKPRDKGTRPERPEIDMEKVSAYLQPIRFEKLLSRDEKYQREYPKSLPDLARAYITDLEKEDQMKGLDESTIKGIKKSAFPWIKLQMDERGFKL